MKTYEIPDELKPSPEKVDIWREKYAAQYFEYEKYVREMAQKYFTDDVLKYKGIKSIKWLNEIFNTIPIDPKLIVEKLDGTKDIVNGAEEIAKYLNKTFIE